MRAYIACTPEELPAAAGITRFYLHVAYRIGPGSGLLRQSLPQKVQGGLLSVSDLEAPPVSNPEQLSAAVLRECVRRSFGGAVLDFEAPYRPDLGAFARKLDGELTAKGRRLYVPPAYGRNTERARVLLCTALSGGSFQEYLTEAADRWGGASRLALDVQRLRMEFRLPAASGEGKPLSGEEFETLLQELHPQSFFSPELCARYFTCSGEGSARFILYDDASTLREKLKIGAALGIEDAFLMWPEIQDLAPELRLRQL